MHLLAGMILDEAGTEDHIHELFVNGMIDMLDQEQQLVDALEEIRSILLSRHDESV